MSAEVIGELAGVALNLYGIRQSERGLEQELAVSERELKEANRLAKEALHVEGIHHDESRALALEQHGQSMHAGFQATIAALREAQLQHAQNARLSYLMHLQDMDVELRTGKREAERDMWEQKNNELQTLMLCASVLIGGSLAILVEGDLPTGVSSVEVNVFAVSTAAGFVLVLLSIFMALLSIKLLGQFMSKKSEVHRLEHHLFLHEINNRALESMDPKDEELLPKIDTEGVVRTNVHGEAKRFVREATDTRCKGSLPGLRTFEDVPMDGIPRPGHVGHTLSANARLTQHFSTSVDERDPLNEAKVPLASIRRKQWVSSHGKLVSQNSLQLRALQNFYAFNHTVMKKYSRFTWYLFCAGTLALLVALSTVMYAKLRLNNGDQLAAYLFISVLSGMVGSGVLALFVMYQLDMKRLTRSFSGDIANLQHRSVEAGASKRGGHTTERSAEGSASSEGRGGHRAAALHPEANLDNHRPRFGNRCGLCRRRSRKRSERTRELEPGRIDFDIDFGKGTFQIVPVETTDSAVVGGTLCTKV